MNKTQQKRFEKKVSALENGTVVLADGSVRTDDEATVDSKGRKTLGNYLSTSGEGNYNGIDSFLLGLDIDDIHAVDRIATASTSTHSPVQNAKRAARALRRVAAQHKA